MDGIGHCIFSPQYLIQNGDCRKLTERRGWTPQTKIPRNSAYGDSCESLSRPGFEQL